jgi:hypothetical protein
MNEQLHSLQSPVLRNNQAIRLMREAKYDSAVQLLSSILSSLSALMRDRLEDLEGSFPLNLYSSGVKFLSCPSIDPSSCERNESPSAHFVIYPLEFPRDLSLSGQTGEVLSYVVIYNLALAWHLWGHKTPQINERHMFMDKALNLYRLADGIMRNGRMKACPSLYMALVNNMGHAYFCLDNSERANACFQLLLETLMCVVDQGIQCTCEFLDGLFSNVVPLILEDQSAPAA